MRYIQAILSIGLFGWLGYGVLTGTLLGGDGGSRNTRALLGMIGDAEAAIGTTNTGLALFAVGILLAGFFLMKARSEARQDAEV